jgi:hypothetical protein
MTYEHPIRIWVNRVSGEVLVRCAAMKPADMLLLNDCVMVYTQNHLGVGARILDTCIVDEGAGAVRGHNWKMLLSEFDEVFDSRGSTPGADSGACTCPMNTLMTQGCTCKGK